MKVVPLTVFGAGYLLGSKAGRQRYEQIVELTGRVSRGFEGSRAQEMLQTSAARLEAYARQNGVSSNGTRRASQEN